MQNNNSQQTAHFKKIDDIISRVNAHQTSALVGDIAARSKWSPSLDLSDGDILKNCIELIAYSQQAQALRVTELIDKGIFDKVFLNYDLEAVANLQHEQLRTKYWNQIGSIRFPQKLEAMIGCAQSLLRIKKQHYSFMTYLRSSKLPVSLRSQSDIDVFWREFRSIQQYLQQKQMPFFNNLTSLCHLLMTLGYACIKPDSAVMGAAVNLGIVSSGNNPEKPTYNDAKRKEVVKTMQAYCLSRDFNIRVLDGYLLIYGGQTGAKALVNQQFYQTLNTTQKSNNEIIERQDNCSAIVSDIAENTGRNNMNRDMPSNLPTFTEKFQAAYDKCEVQSIFNELVRRFPKTIEQKTRNIPDYVMSNKDVFCGISLRRKWLIVTLRVDNYHLSSKLLELTENKDKTMPGKRWLDFKVCNKNEIEEAYRLIYEVYKFSA